MKASPEELFRSLEGFITPLQRELLRHITRVICEQTEQIKRTDELIDKYMGDAYKQAAKALTVIPGIGLTSAQQIVAEIGHDMSIAVPLQKRLKESERFYRRTRNRKEAQPELR